MISDRELERTLKAVANRKRILILRHLKTGSSTVGEIAKAIKLSVKATSHHLQQLSATGYTTSEQRGLFIHYSLNPQTDVVARILKTLPL